jgi:predicted nucleic acid-binding protein
VRAVLALALKHHLTPYEAAYLDLALDEALPLASLDKELERRPTRLNRWVPKSVLF